VTGQLGRAHRESYAERRARHGEIDEPDVVLAAGFRFLEARARSVVETRRRLAEAGYRPALIEGAIERLLAIGLLDDEVFARNWIESRDRASPRGESALRRELRLRGVEGAIVDATLEARRSGEAESRLGFRRPDTLDDSDGTEVDDPEEAAARRLLDRRRRDLDRVVDPRKRRARAYALLARNGFSPEIAGRLAAALVAEGDAES
jgi:regulatory protein